MREITYAEAIREAMSEEMRRDGDVFFMGEDIGIYGGAFGVSVGMLEEFGPERVRDTPISEAVLIGAGAGAAVTGSRPIVEIQFSDFITIGMDQLVNQAAKMRYMFGGRAQVPLTIRAPAGPLLTIETDKVTMEVEAEASGVLLRVLRNAGEVVPVTETIGYIGSPGEAVPAAGSTVSEVERPAASRAPLSAEAVVPLPPSIRKSSRVAATPSARRLAAAHGVDLSAVNATGERGEVRARDVQSVIQPAGTTSNPVAASVSAQLHSGPQYSLRVAVLMDELLATRARLNEGRDKKASLSAFLLALAGRALLRHPVVNSTWNGDSIIRHVSADVGLAVALPDGLLTPVVRDCAHKGFLSIDAELSGLIEQARTGKLASPEDKGGTFTIINLGPSGIDEFTAVIRPPASAILGVGAIRREPVVLDDDTVAVRQRMRITLTCDHRVIDGAQGAAFLRELADMLEKPILALA